MASKKTRRQKSRRPQPPPPTGGGHKPAKPRPSGDAPRRRGRLFWVCALVLVEVLVWSVASAIIDSDSARTLAAIGAGAALVVVFRHRIWGPDWRSEVAASRARRPR